MDVFKALQIVGLMAGLAFSFQSSAGLISGEPFFAKDFAKDTKANTETHQSADESQSGSDAATRTVSNETRTAEAEQAEEANAPTKRHHEGKLANQ